MGGLDPGEASRGDLPVKGFLDHKGFELALRIVIGGLFVYSGGVKIMDPLSFADSIETFKLLPPHAINLLAMSLPPFELIMGLLLATGWRKRAAALAISVLAIVFAVALAQGMARGLKVDCGCFGGGAPSPGEIWFSLGRDLLLLATSAWLYLGICRESKAL